MFESFVWIFRLEYRTWDFWFAQFRDFRLETSSEVHWPLGSFASNLCLEIIRLGSFSWHWSGLQAWRCLVGCVNWLGFSLGTYRLESRVWDLSFGILGILRLEWPLGKTLNMYGYWFWLHVGIDIDIDIDIGIGIGVGIVVGVGICIGICVGVGAGIGVGIGSISEQLASGSI